MKTITCLLLVLLSISLMSTAMAESNKQEPPLIIAMSNDTYPFQFVDENNQASGLLVDIWLHWSKQTNRKVVFKPTDWVQSLKNLQNGVADVHIGMAKTSTRENHYQFLPELLSFHSFLYVNYQLPKPQTLSQLMPYKIGVVRGAAQIDILQQQEPRLTFSYFDNRTDLLKAVINEEIFVFVGLEGFLRESQINNTISIQFPKENRKEISKLSFYPAILKDRTELSKTVQAGFSAMPSDIIDELTRHWLGNQRYQNDIVIAMQTGVAPFADLGADGLPNGLLVDIWKLWSEKTGLPVRFVVGTMKQSVDNVKRGIADVHLGYPESASIQTGLNRAHTIYKVTSRLFSYGSQLDSLEQLKNKVIAVSPTSPYLAELIEALPDSHIRYYSSMTEMIDAAKNDEIDAFVAAGAWTQHYLLLDQSWGAFYQYPDLEFNTELYVLNRNKDVGFAARIAAGFTQISPLELAQVERKWMLNPADRIYKDQQGLIHLTAEQQNIINDTGVIKVGYLRDWPPMEFEENGLYSGINSDVINIIANELSLTVETVVFDEWQSLLDALVTGGVDMVGSVAKTAEREYQLGFSEAYWPAPWGLVTSHSNINVFGLEELRGQRIAVVEGYHIIGQLMREYPELKLVLVPDSSSGLNAVNLGKADVFIDKVTNLSSGLRQGQYSDLKMSMLVDFAEQRSHIGVHSSKKSLLPLINVVLASIDPVQQRKIHQKWVTQTVAFERDEYEARVKLGIAIFTVLGLGVIGALLANRRLRKEILRRTEAETQMAHFAKHDSLTELPNRSLIDDRLEQAILLHTRDTAQFAVIFIDLDGFKLINDQLGHQVGDQFLVHVAKELVKGIRRSDTVGRLGGDEFVVILNDIKDIKSVYDVAENLLNRLSQPFIIADHTLTASASVGIALFPIDGDCIDALLKTADKQMYRAKNAGGRTYRSS
ncbi:transporter substrate-binding domain-containing protein [Shewanella marinintestina]|uniref:diguanylate cyclase domain-containing protein n=1 Tax=Shewanella marinintestina TaxID=190305 RepID=UPI00200F17D6|nr:transporter substrate-binding domain-containing protein [Shewanella marinintestina]MCL1144655.1 transporter substrate-binding domain-containing protein [Shewanella marinintestina]